MKKGMRKRAMALLLTLVLCLSVTAPAYADFYQQPKGIKGLLMDGDVMFDDVRELGVKQVIVNMEISNIYKTDMLRAYEMFFEKLKNAGISLTVIVLNDWQSYEPALLPVSVPAATNYYAFNTLTQEGLDATRSAAHTFAQRFKNLVSNWVIGNEVNDGQLWNYIGPMDIDTYCANYATAFRIWYEEIKAENSLARVFIPFDYRWNTGALTGYKFTVRDMLPRLNTLLADTDYGIAWHAYPQDFTNPAWWNDTAPVNSESTTIINLKNLNVLTDYMQQASMLSPNGTVRHLILSEQGFTSFSPANGGECLELQSEAITRAYQAAAANPYVEAFMLNRYVDEASLVAQNYAFGLWSNDPFSSWSSDPLERKPSWYAYRDVDAQ